MASDRFLLDDSLPERIVVREVTPEGHATCIFAVVADYGWAERILAGDCYEDIANDLAFTVAEYLDVPCAGSERETRDA